MGYLKTRIFVTIVSMMFITSALAAFSTVTMPVIADSPTGGPTIENETFSPKYPIEGDTIYYNSSIWDKDGVNENPGGMLPATPTFEFCDDVGCFPDIYYPSIDITDPDPWCGIYGSTIDPAAGSTWIHAYVIAEDWDGFVTTGDTVWQPIVSEINVTLDAVTTPKLVGDTFTVSGQANYIDDLVAGGMNNVYGKDYVPTETSEVTATFVGGGVTQTGQTDTDGNYNFASFSVPTTPGTYELNITVKNKSVGGNVRLTGWAETTIEIIEITSMEVTEEVSQTSPKPNTQLYVNGTAKYNDDSNATNENVNITIKGKTNGTIVAYDNTTKVDATGNYSVQIKAPSEIGFYKVNVTIFSTAYGITGYNETEIEVTLVEVIDFNLTSNDIEITFANASAIDGDTITINATVDNTGNTAAICMLILYTNQSGTRALNEIGNKSFGINAGESNTFSFGWTPPPGYHMITAKADPDDAVAEADETNNIGEKAQFIDRDTDNDGIGNLDDDDDDQDGYNDTIEEELGTDPLDKLDTPPDLDLDLIPDVYDDDIDGDKVLNEEDAFPRDPDESEDYDGDGVGDNTDPDDDNDGIPDDVDEMPYDTDNDGLDNDLDDDDDNDGILDVNDIGPNGEDYSQDTDNDGLRNDQDDDD